MRYDDRDLGFDMPDRRSAALKIWRMEAIGKVRSITLAEED